MPGAGGAAALSQTVWAPPIGIAAVFLPLLFPDGHLPGRRWRWVAYAGGFGIVATMVLALLSPELLHGTPYAAADNPFAVAGLGEVTDRLQLVILLIPVCMVAAAASLVVRFRRSPEIERQQIKWLAAAVATVAAFFLCDLVISSATAGSSTGEPGWLVAIDNLSVVALGLIPLAIMISVLRYRLYEIDVIIRRTIIYACLVAALAVVYLTGIAVVGTVLRSLTGASGTVAVTLSTLVVAAVFQPLRGGIQRVVDRRFYRTDTTRRPRWMSSTGGCANRSTSMPSARNCVPWSRARCTRRTPACGCARRPAAGMSLCIHGRKCSRASIY